MESEPMNSDDKKPGQPLDYRGTVHLPVTEFPMRANLPEREPELLRRWQEERIYERLVEQNREREPFVLHDGPPYANNDIHQGHALQKTLKDIIGKYRGMSGRLTDIVPGWDCHGLPIELAVDKQLGSKKRALSTAEFRLECRRYADKWVGVQRDSFRRLGIFMRWEQPYLTMSFDYEAQTVRELAKFAGSGSLYRQKKPVHWCPRDRTALAEAEIEYADRTSPSIYVGMRLESNPAKLHPSLSGKPVDLVIWTTTPWTLPANLAIAASGSFTYVAYQLGDRVVVVAKDLLSRFLAECAPGELQVREADAVGVAEAASLAEPSRILAFFEGTALEGHTYRHPFYDRVSPVLLGEHVTLEQGTGLVHTAPGHGQEDYVLGRRNGLEVLAPVDARGRYTAEAPGLEGEFVFDANAGIVEKLHQSGHLLSDPAATLRHSYPHCWRCDGPVIFRATDQWFISMSANGLREKSLRAIDDEVTWVPHWGKPRIQAMVQNRPDWCISRQRAWGVPIVAFYCEGCDACVQTPELMNRVADLFEKEGADAWVTHTAAELLPEGFTCPSCQGNEFRKETDILDVWFDSGVSFAGVLEKRENNRVPADLYFEGSDQHRGWFNSSLMISVATRGRAPYRTVVTHGFVVDGQGRKLSKRLGNGVPLDVMLKKYGADILRLWVAAEDYRDDIRLSDEILANLSEGYRKIRNTLRFALGSLHGFDPATDSVSASELEPLDRWALEQLARWTERMHEAYEKYEFHLAYHATTEFCAKTLSSLYFDVLKDRLYTHAKKSVSRRAAQTVLHRVADALCRMLAPILSFTADEAWRQLPGRSTDTVFLAGLPAADELRRGLAPGEGEALVARYERLFEEVRAPVQKAMEELKAAQQPLFRELKDLEKQAKAAPLDDAARARKQAIEAEVIGNSLDARIVLAATGETRELLEKNLAELPALLIVSQVALADANASPAQGGRAFDALTVFVLPAEGERCARCWCYTTERGLDANHPELCPKCTRAVIEDAVEVATNA